MSVGGLFGTSTSGPGSTAGNKHLIEIRAGKMYFKGKLLLALISICPLHSDNDYVPNIARLDKLKLTRTFPTFRRFI